MWSLSPNGRTVAFSQVEDDRRNQIWLLDLMRGAPDRFTSGPFRALLPQWNSKGDEIVFTRDEGAEGGGLGVKRLGSERSSSMTELRTFGVAYDWHGKPLLFAMQTSTGVYNFWRLTTDSSRKPEPWFSSKFAHSAAQFSPDGRWVAYSSNETDAYQVYVRRFPEADRQVRVSTAGGNSPNSPRWRPDGQAVFYLRNDVLMQVDLDIGENVKPGVPRQLFPLGENCGYAVLPDGRFVVCRPIDPVPPPTITVVLNWVAGLKPK
jgi:Tol biopolymer transport system component